MRTFKVVVDGTQYSVEVEEVGAQSVNTAPASVQPVVAAPVVAKAAAPVETKVAAPVAAKAAAPAGGTQLIAPMPGDINKIVTPTGTVVKCGQAVVILEAMKMENDIAAPVDGTVTILVKAGDKVNSGDVIAVIA